MEEKSLFIKLDRHKEVNELIQQIEKTKEQASEKIESMKEIMMKEKDLLENFEESLKRSSAYVEDAKNLLNTD